MWNIFVMAFLLAISFTMADTNLTLARERIDRTTAAATAMNFGVYANASNSYAMAHPTFVGLIPLGSLNLPVWYAPRPGLAAYMDSSHVLVFEPQASATAGSRTLRGIASNSIKTGLVVSGQIYSPTNAVLFAAPSAIPDNAVVQIVR